MDSSLFKRFPGEGLIKSADLPRADVEIDQKARLNRRGNELFNGGDLESARRIFQTTGYSDGLIRVGNRYMQENRPVEALKMYWLARDEPRIEKLLGTMTIVIQNLLREEQKEKEKEQHSE